MRNRGSRGLTAGSGGDGEHHSADGEPCSHTAGLAAPGSERKDAQLAVQGCHVPVCQPSAISVAHLQTTRNAQRLSIARDVSSGHTCQKSGNHNTCVLLLAFLHTVNSQVLMGKRRGRRVCPLVWFKMGAEGSPLSRGISVGSGVGAPRRRGR